MILNKNQMIDALVENVDNWDEVELYKFCLTMMQQDPAASSVDISEYDEFELTTFAKSLMRRDLEPRPEYIIRGIYLHSNASRGGGNCT